MSKECEKCETTCSSCGRPWAICKSSGGCGGCGEVKFCEYGRSAMGCIRDTNPGCPINAVIPSVTVETIEGIKGLSNCLVHIASTNTTLYLDDKHRPLEVYEGMVQVHDYDYENNPLKLRNQITYDTTNGYMAIFDGEGVAHKVNIDDTDKDYNLLTNKPSVNGVELSGNKTSSDLGLQEELIAGSNIQIESDGRTISATDTTYTAGSNIQIEDNVISATDTTYTGGDGISVENDVIYGMPATSADLGMVKPGRGLSIDSTGALSVDDTTVDYHKSVLGERIINAQKSTVACVGDSLTWCQKPGDTSVQLTTWESMLSSFINSWYNIPDLLTCINYGVKGQQSAASITNFDSYISENPQTIFWAYGTNDMTQGVTVDQFLDNLRAFYELCIENDKELIVIISPPSFQSQLRRDKMLNLARAERAFCQKYGIRYVDMFEYVDNLYSSQAYAHNVLQSDNTHFSDYTCYRDAILSALFSVTFNQDSKAVDYIDIGEARNFFHCNGNAITVAGGINMFNRGYRLRQGESSENAFAINIQLNKKSKIYFLTYGNNTAGTIDYSINGSTATTIDTMSNPNSSSTTDKSLVEFLQIGGIQNAGLKHIEFSNPVYPGGSGGRIYVFGFIVQEIPDVMADSTREFQLKKQANLWTGDATSLTAVSMYQDLHNYNKLLLEFGTTASGISYAEIYPHSPTANFNEDGSNTTIPYFILIPTASDSVPATVTIDHENNTISFVADGTVRLRRVYGLMDNTNKGYLPVSQLDINSEINFQ